MYTTLSLYLSLIALEKLSAYKTERFTAECQRQFLKLSEINLYSILPLVDAVKMLEGDYKFATSGKLQSSNKYFILLSSPSSIEMLP